MSINTISAISRTKNFFLALDSEKFSTLQSNIKPLLQVMDLEQMLEIAQNTGYDVYIVQDTGALSYTHFQKGNLLILQGNTGEGLIAMVTNPCASQNGAMRLVVFAANSTYKVSKRVDEVRYWEITKDIKLRGIISIKELLKSKLKPQEEIYSPPPGWIKYEATTSGYAVYLPPKGVDVTYFNGNSGPITEFSFKDGSTILKTYKEKYQLGDFIGFYEGVNKYENSSLRLLKTSGLLLQEKGILLGFLASKLIIPFRFNEDVYILGISFNSANSKPYMIEKNTSFPTRNGIIDSLQVIQVIEKTGYFPSDLDSELFNNKPYSQLKVEMLNLYPNQFGLVNGDLTQGYFVLNAYKYSENNTNYEGIVDGGPYSTLGLQGNASSKAYFDVSFLAQKYYMKEKDITDWVNGDGYYFFNDLPGVINIAKDVRFTTILIGTNFLGSGKDILICSIKWGTSKQIGISPNIFWINPVTNIASNNYVLEGGIDNNIKSIIQHDYPTYLLWGDI